jgi:hypothetical protein
MKKYIWIFAIFIIAIFIYAYNKTSSNIVFICSGRTLNNNYSHVYHKNKNCVNLRNCSADILAVDVKKHCHY